MTFPPKQPRLAKELRPLLLPWFIAVIAGGLVGLRPLVADGVGLEGLLVGVATYGFFGGLALLAAMSFGTEFHERTLPLLLTQPFSRSRLWNQKMLTLTAAIAAAALVECALLAGISAWYPGDELLNTVRAVFGDGELFLAGIFLLATVCSCGFWTLVAGSTIGGLVFTVSGQFVSALALALVVARIRGKEEPFQNPQTFLALVVGGLVYSVVFLWLGWRKFTRLEVRSTRFGEGAVHSGASPWKTPWSRFVVARPTGRVLNLVRKELLLQKPVFMIAAVFVICWLATVLLQGLRPKQNVRYLFDILTCLYAPIAALLAGCVSLGEEKTLGLAAAQLTLPFSPRLQWLVKLAACLAIATIIGLGLPWVLFWTTGAVLDLSANGLINPNDHGLLALSCFSTLAFLFGFWAISLTPNTVRAALVAVVGLVGLGACAALGIWCGNRSNGLELGLLTSLMCHFQLPPEVFQGQTAKVARALGYFIVGVIIVIMLRQSLIQFCRSESPGRQLFEYSLALAGLVVGLSFWATDITTSAGQMYNSLPIQELKSAVNFIASKNPQLDQRNPRVVSVQDLDGRISEQTKVWLRNAKVSYSCVHAKNFKEGDTTYQASVVFPNGRIFWFVGGYIHGLHGMQTW